MHRHYAKDMRTRKKNVNNVEWKGRMERGEGVDEWLPFYDLQAIPFSLDRRGGTKEDKLDPKSGMMAI
jgi:hypothetical protein